MKKKGPRLPRLLTHRPSRLVPEPDEPRPEVKPAPGRKVITDAVRTGVLKALAEGQSQKRAAARHGVSLSTVAKIAREARNRTNQ